MHVTNIDLDPCRCVFMEFSKFQAGVNEQALSYVLIGTSTSGFTATPFNNAGVVAPGKLPPFTTLESYPAIVWLLAEPWTIEEDGVGVVRRVA